MSFDHNIDSMRMRREIGYPDKPILAALRTKLAVT